MVVKAMWNAPTPIADASALPNPPKRSPDATSNRSVTSLHQIVVGTGIQGSDFRGCRR
jgi:hypothetical protein